MMVLFPWRQLALGSRVLVKSKDTFQAGIVMRFGKNRAERTIVWVELDGVEKPIPAWNIYRENET